MSAHKSVRLPAVDRAEQYIRGLASSAATIPGIKSIAREAGVSLVSAWKAVQRLKAEGLVTVRPKVGIQIASGKRVATEPAPGPARATPTTKTRRVAAKMHSDLLQASLPAGDLFPTYKELCRRYCCDYRTARKAVDIIERETATRVGALGAPRSRGTVVLIAWGHDDGRMQVPNPWAETHVRILERECAQADLRLQVLTYGEESRQPFYLDRSGNGHTVVPGGAEAIGFLVWTVGPPDSVRKTLHELRAYRKPIAVLDEEEKHDLVSMISGNRLARTFRFSSNERPARSVARLLSLRGHRRIAFISATHASKWSQIRLRGLFDALSDYGRECVVKAFTIDEYEGPDEFFTDDRLGATVVTALNSALKGQRSDRHRVATDPLDRFIARMAFVAPGIIQDEVMVDQLERQFEQALRDTQISAWVCAHDRVAIAAIEFLRRRGIAVPARLSVVGFDDSPEALRHDMTSVNFNLDGLAHAMLSHVLHPRFTPKGSEPIEIESILMERGSTGEQSACLGTPGSDLS